MTAFVSGLALRNSVTFSRGLNYYDGSEQKPRRRTFGHKFIAAADTGEDDSPSSDPNGQELPSFEQLFLKGPVPGDQLVRTISASGEVSCRAITSTGLVNGASRLHRTSVVATTAFGRLLTCSLLLASGKKDGEHVQVEFRGNGPMGGLTAIANGLGEVRGFVGNPRVDLPLRNGQLDVPSAIGKGILAVVRNSPIAKTPYTGLVAISSGEVAEDLTQYLADSEQVPSALAAGVYIERNGSVSAAAGYLVQLLPGASERTAQIVEHNVRNVGSPTELVRMGRTAEAIVEELMADLNPMNVASVSPRYYCPCGIDRVKRTVALLSTTEIRDVVTKYGKLEGAYFFKFPYTLPNNLYHKRSYVHVFKHIYLICIIVTNSQLLFLDYFLLRDAAPLLQRRANFVGRYMPSFLMRSSRCYRLDKRKMIAASMTNETARGKQTPLYLAANNQFNMELSVE